MSLVLGATVIFTATQPSHQQSRRAPPKDGGIPEGEIVWDAEEDTTLRPRREDDGGEALLSEDDGRRMVELKKKLAEIRGRQAGGDPDPGRPAPHKAELPHDELIAHRAHMGAELVTHRDGGAPVEVDGKHQRQFESCMAVDHAARLNNEDPQHPDRAQADFKHSLEWAMESGRDRCVPELVDAFCKAEAKMLYDYSAMEPHSSCRVHNANGVIVAGGNAKDARTRLKEMAQRQRMHAQDRAAKKRFGREALAVAEPRERDTADGILFLMVVYSRNFVQQIKRIVKHLWRPAHTIVFHVDASAGSDYLVRELDLLCAGHENMHVLPTRFDTTWGGSGLMHMYLAAIKFSLSFRWDHFINLSEQDFPLVSVERLQAFLAPKLGKSFLNAKLEKTAKERERLIGKQGIKFVCRQCERYMFRIAQREVPKNINFVVGSDWYMLSREFCEYLANDESRYLRAMKAFFGETILSAESFLHTMAANGQHCHTIEWNNHRFENWITGKGCQCAKTAVDWCGCSPLTLRKDDAQVLREHSSFRFFARKFDPRLDMEVLRAVEMNAQPAGHAIESREFSPQTDRGKYFYWSNIYHWRDVVKKVSKDLPKFGFWSSMVLEQLHKADRSCKLRPELPETVDNAEAEGSGVTHVHTIYADADMEGVSFQKSIANSDGWVVRIRTTLEDGTPVVMEALVHESIHRETILQKRMTQPPAVPRLEAFDIGAKWDLKNSVYWAEGPSFNPRGSEIWAVQAWRKQKDGQLRLPELTFVGCFGNGGNHARWNRVSSKDKSKSQCTREAMENGHVYMMMEWSEGFKHGHAECSTLRNLPKNVHQFKTDDAECRSDDGELIGRYFRGAIYKLPTSAKAAKSKSVLPVTLKLVNPWGRVASTASFDVKSTDTESSQLLDLKDDAEPGVYTLQLIINATTEDTQAGPAAWLGLAKTPKFQVEMPFFVEPTTAAHSAWQQSLPFWEVAGICVEDQSLPTIADACPSSSVPSCSQARWSTLQDGLDLTLTA